MPVPASSAPRASATFASSDRAPKLMSDTKSGMSSRSGFFAPGPIVTSLPTSTSSSWGGVASCAVTNWIVSQRGSSGPGTPIAATGPCAPFSPCAASVWIALVCGSSGVPCTSWYVPW